MSDPREMHTEISELVGTIGKAFMLEDEQVIKVLESGDVSLSFHDDENGNPYVLAEYNGRRARLYKGAISFENSAGVLQQ